MALDIAPLVEPIAADAPTGRDPALHDGAYQALQEAIKGRVDYKVVGGDEVRVYHPPDWQAIYDQALDCASRTRDLRVCLMLMRAAASKEGPAGLLAGIELLRLTIARFWDDLHPAQDSDSDDPSERVFRRVTALNELADRGGLLRDLRDMPLVDARGYGRYGLRAIHLAQGKEVPGAGEDVAESGLVQGALGNDPAVGETRTTIAAARQAVGSLDQELRALLGNDAPDLAPLGRTLDEMAVALGASAPAQAAPASPSGAGAPPASAASAASAVPDEIHSREQVVAALDRILAYYARHEAASPIPLLLKRVKRLVPMDFLDLMEDLAPAAVKQIKEIGGIGGKKSDD